MTKNKVILFSIILCTILTRFVFLGSDSSVLLDSGQVGDEGYWLYNARNLVLFGKTAQDQFYHDYAAAPFFSFLATFSFSIFGTGFWQGRIVSAISGLLTVFVTYKIGLLFSRRTALLSSLLVSTSTLLILHNRLAVGESLQIFLINASLYLYLIGRLVPSGSLLAAGVLAKTTAILYLPSFVILNLASILKNRVNFSKVFRFWLAFLSVLLIVFVPILFFWSDKIFLIYATFGDWLKPQSLIEVFNNATSFFIHPFWGSPFNFSLAMLASLNIINYFTSNGAKGSHRKLLVYWLLGILILGPLISRITNARLLPLIIPMAVLSAETILNNQIAKISLEDLLLKISRSYLIEKLILFISTIPLAFIFSKILLALAKRIFNQQLIVQYLPHLSLVLIPIFFGLVLILKKKIRKPLVLGVVSLLILFPFLASVRVSVGLLEFFRITGGIQTQFVSFIVLVSYLLLTMVFFKLKFDFKKVKNLLIFVYFVFNLFGISTILLNPTFGLVNASKTLGAIVGPSAVIGFYGHELSLENRLTPIYWAPRLEKVNKVNSNFQKYSPGYLLEKQTFDLPYLKPDVWPTMADVRNAQQIETFDLSRNFLGAERDFKLILYRINN